ncbi:MAG: deoxyuridine 5'-triphosphate nucleotidohydrolase [Bacilli bacterium]|nr:deoxyuridine 5'-triphosphate nucleotidohydrolase [Bacilli bacterium]
MKERFFEKISFNQFKKDISSDEELYNSYELPKRKTKYSAGYDFIAINDFELKPNEIIKIPTGIKAKFLDNEFLMLAVRSSMGFKFNVRMCNQVGIIDSDYYNNKENEGHIWIALQNQGDLTYKVSKGDGICQGIFIKYYTCDDVVEKERTGWSWNSNKEGEDNNE